MSALDAWRREIRALIPRGFLRRDRGAGLFISDYPRFPGAEDVKAQLRAAGFRADASGGMARINAAAERYRAFFRALPCPDVPPTDETLFAVSLAYRLIRAGTLPEEEPLDFYPALLKALDQGNWDEAARKTAAFAALCQRRHKPLPSAAGRLILGALNERKGEDRPC